MKHALIIGDSGGIGAAMATALRARGAAVIGLSRARDGFDLTRPEQVEAKLSALTPGFDLILVATGALTCHAPRPEKALSEITATEMAAQFAVNAIGPALVMRHVPRLLTREADATVAVLSARVGSISDNRLGGWVSYRAAKAALNQILRTTAIELGRSHPKATCVALHPGTVETDLTRGYAGYEKQSPQDCAQRLLSVIANLNPRQTGRFLAWDGAEIPW